MTNEFDSALSQLRKVAAYHDGKARPALLSGDEARVLIAALDTWRESLTTLGRDAANEQGSDRYTTQVVADALGVSVAELERLVAE